MRLVAIPTRNQSFVSIAQTERLERNIAFRRTIEILSPEWANPFGILWYPQFLVRMKNKNSTEFLQQPHRGWAGSLLPIILQHRWGSDFLIFPTSLLPSSRFRASQGCALQTLVQSRIAVADYKGEKQLLHAECVPILFQFPISIRGRVWLVFPNVRSGEIEWRSSPEIL
jgi:hypothetical protein